MMLIAVNGFGCFKSQDTEEGTPLGWALKTVPLDFQDKVAWFNDRLAARARHDMEDIRGQALFEAVIEQGVVIPFDGLAVNHYLRDYQMRMAEQVGFSNWNMDAEIWADVSPWLFWVGSGPLDQAEIKNNLFDLGYKRKEYENTSYYALNDDYQFTVDSKLGMLGLALNRVAFDGDTVLTASATDILQPLIDAKDESVPSLWNSAPHRRLAETLGEKVLGVAFLPSGWAAQRIRQFRNQEQIQALVEPYREGGTDWRSLGSYGFAAFGYKVVNEEDRLILAMYYDDADQAGKDAAVLQERWDTYHFTLRDVEEVYSTASCSPLSIEAFRGDDYSTLVANCSVRSGSSYPEGASLWHKMIEAGDVLFLVPNLQKLLE